VSHLTDTNTPTHPTHFSELGLHETLLQAVYAQGYTTPTPIQAQAIPVALAGKDVLGAAQTGTGKTASFSLPILQRLQPFANTSASPARHPVRALVLTPTRELADQVANNMQTYSQYTSLRSTPIFGGMDMQPQAEQLRRGVEILIATPGRLLDHLQQKNTKLNEVQILVLDEADRMLDMGFLPDLHRIFELLPSNRQTLLFSATFSPEITKLAARYLHNPVTINVAARNTTATNVRQYVYNVEPKDKPAAVIELLRRYALKQVIVFCNSKLGASRLTRYMEHAGISAASIHGDKTQKERMDALERFKQGDIIALVATDVAARGLDIAELPAVINFDLPFNPEDYVHRIGRTGRAGASGDALSLCSAEDAKYLDAIEKLIQRPFEREVLMIASAPKERKSGSIHHESRATHHVKHSATRQKDRIFSTPYIPDPKILEAERQRHSAVKGNARGMTSMRSGASKKRPLAVLLGGEALKKKEH
jgi:ATP-dependent RNA helicase RhlE